MLSFRHLLKDLETLLPHSKKESKIEHKEHLYTLNEIAENRNCDSCIFLECRKKRDLYMWFSKTPNGPSAKFLVRNGLYFFYAFVNLAHLCPHSAYAG